MNRSHLVRMNKPESCCSIR